MYINALYKNINLMYIALHCQVAITPTLAETLAKDLLIRKTQEGQICLPSDINFAHCVFESISAKLMFTQLLGTGGTKYRTQE